MKRQLSTEFAAGLLTVVLAACGSTAEDRALGGGGLGAAAGAGAAAVTGGNPLIGAVLGGAGGAAAGALTDEEDIDLGEPLWE